MVSVSPVIPPSAPRNLRATEGDSRVDLSWDPPADDGGNPIALYFIYRGTDPNQYIPPLSGGVIDGSVRTYTDTAVTNGITYYYQVSAVTSPGRNLEGPRSRIVEATPGGGATIPPVPALIGPGTTAEPGETISTLTPTLQWNSASGATYYKVYVSKSPYGSSDIVYSNENVAGTSIPLPSNALQQGTKYNWDVGACNSAGCSEQSSDLYFQTETPVYNTAFLTNAQLTNYKSMSTRQIRNFLVKYNSYFRKSVLDVDGVSFDAATVISQAAQKYQINPKVILATLQKENQGVTTATRPSDSTMKFLMGCVSSSTARAQLTCAAERFRAYHNQLTNTGATVSGWKVGVPKTTQDGVVVTPATKAVAGQFTYTPLAGVQWGGNDPRWGGVYLFYYWWNYFGFA
ncbi:fibronectin type III domain-containing protein [Candidatus Woesearchaeota archaeon]|nr:fibronectin type III domain-containing protein [Candidatus Woesearchaeota archaeon]